MTSAVRPPWLFVACASPPLVGMGKQFRDKQDLPSLARFGFLRDLAQDGGGFATPAAPDENAHGAPSFCAGIVIGFSIACGGAGGQANPAAAVCKDAVKISFKFF